MAMNAAEKSGDRLFRLAGEDAPVPVAAAFAALGFLLATVASAQFMNEWVAPPPPAAERAAAPSAPPEGQETKPAPNVPPPAATPDPRPKSPRPKSPRRRRPARRRRLLLRRRSRRRPPQPRLRPLPRPPRLQSWPRPPRRRLPRRLLPPRPPPFPPRPPLLRPRPRTAVCLPVVAIAFDLNSARLKDTGLDDRAAPLRDWLLAHKEAVLSVEGHADASGPEAFNVLLSYKRAEKVAAWLAQFGAPAAQIATRAAGTRPPAHWTADMQNNRQVILQIEGVAVCREGAAPAGEP